MKFRNFILFVSILIFSLGWPTGQTDPDDDESVEINSKEEEVEDPDSDSENPEELGPYYEGDMEIENDEMQTSFSAYNGIIGEDYRWPDAEVVYTYDKSFPKKFKKNIKKAMKMISDTTCITFRKKGKKDKNYVLIRSIGKGCGSQVGMKGGMQTLDLDRNCFKKGSGTAAHEFIHALGFRHEHCRSDRDKYVQINWDNITKKGKKNFKEYSTSEVYAYGVKYDYESFMHYGKDYMGKVDEDGHKLETITVLKKGVKIGQRKTLSATDIAKINKMYGCVEN